MDTNLQSVEELVNWCFGDIKVIAETLGISVPVCRLQAVCTDLRATCSRFEKISFVIIGVSVQWPLWILLGAISCRACSPAV